VTPSVVESARGAAVVLGGLATGGKGNDVVDLAVLGWQVAVGVEALPVPELHRPAQPTGEQALCDTQIDDARRPVEQTRSIQDWGSQPTTLPGVTTAPLASSQMRPAKVS